MNVSARVTAGIYVRTTYHGSLEYVPAYLLTGQNPNSPRLQETARQVRRTVWSLMELGSKNVSIITDTHSVSIKEEPC
jgi:hypothetical protein